MINQWSMDKNDYYTGIFEIPLEYYLIPFILFTIVFSIFLIWNFKKRELTSRITILRYMSYILLLILVICCFMFKVIVIFISAGQSDGNIIWLLLNSLIFYMYLNIVGVKRKYKSNRQKYLLFFIVLFIALSGFGYFGFIIKINYMFFISYQYFQTNSVKGIYFFTYNSWLFLLFYFITMFMESDTN